MKHMGTFVDELMKFRAHAHVFHYSSIVCSLLQVSCFWEPEKPRAVSERIFQCLDLTTQRVKP